MVSAGRVLIMPKGAYDASETYSMLDLVSYNGSSYIAKKSTTGNLPTNTTYWQLSAYGGSASNIAGNFATLETTDYASQNYAVGDYLVTKDSQLCEVIATITTGDELVIDTNIEVTSVEAMIEGVKDYVDDLDEENVKLKGMTAISVQTDLDTMTTIGNYYKSSGSFYVTNAPTGIDSEITALFRLTVENGSDSTDKYLQTLITNDGTTYKRGYDGSDWSDWIEFSTADVVATKQPKTLATPITIGGAVKTTVEAALGALEDAKADTSVTDSLTSSVQTLEDNDDAMLNVLGAKNLLPMYGTSQTINGVQVQVASDGSYTLDGTNNGTYAEFYLVPIGKSFTLQAGTYILSGIFATQEGATLGNVGIIYTDDTANFLTGESATFTISEAKTVKAVRHSMGNGNTYHAKVYPMLRLAKIADDTYVPYAMTNRELTANVTPQETNIRTSLNTLLQAADSDFSAQAVWLTTYGELKVLSGRISVASAKDYHYTINVSNIIPKPKNVTNFPCMGTDMYAGGCMMLNTNGELIIRIRSTAVSTYFDFVGVYV